MSGRVHDAYIAGAGILYASMFGLVPLADVYGTPEAARGELIRFLTRSCLVPDRTAAEPGRSVGIGDASSALATLRDGATK